MPLQLFLTAEQGERRLTGRGWARSAYQGKSVGLRDTNFLFTLPRLAFEKCGLLMCVRPPSPAHLPSQVSIKGNAKSFRNSNL